MKLTMNCIGGEVMTAWATSPASVWTGFIIGIAYLVVSLMDIENMEEE